MILSCLNADDNDRAEAIARRFCGSGPPSATLFAPIIELSPPDKAMELFKELKTIRDRVDDRAGERELIDPHDDGERDGVIPAERAVAFQAAMLSCAVGGAGESAQSLLDQMSRERVEPSPRIIHNAFQAFAGSSPPMWRESCLLFENLHDRDQSTVSGESHLHLGDHVVHAVDCCASNGEFEAAYDCLRSALSVPEYRPTAAVLRSALKACVHVREKTFEQWFSKPGYAEESMRRLGTGNEIFNLYDAYGVRLHSLIILGHALPVPAFVFGTMIFLHSLVTTLK